MNQFVENKDLDGLKKKRIPDPMTWYRDWYLYLRWWTINGPGLYPMEAGAIAAAVSVVLLLFVYCFCCGCGNAKKKTNIKQPPAEEEKKTPGTPSPNKPKRE